MKKGNGCSHSPFCVEKRKRGEPAFSLQNIENANITEECKNV